MEERLEKIENEIKQLKEQVEVMNGTLNNIFNLVSSNKKVSEVQAEAYHDLSISYLQAGMKIKEAQG